MLKRFNIWNFFPHHANFPKISGHRKTAQGVTFSATFSNSNLFQSIIEISFFPFYPYYDEISQQLKLKYETQKICKYAV